MFGYDILQTLEQDADEMNKENFESQNLRHTNGQEGTFSLRDVLLKPLPIQGSEEGENEVESFIIKKDTLRIKRSQDAGPIERTFIVKRTELKFNEIDCQVLNFSEITTYKKLKKEEENNRLLRALNVSAHHEMLGPLQANIDIAARLVKRLKDEELQRMSQTILISNQLVLLHAQDLIDSEQLVNNVFVPAY